MGRYAALIHLIHPTLAAERVKDGAPRFIFIAVICDALH
jgi:hypothetical protein